MMKRDDANAAPVIHIYELQFISQTRSLNDANRFRLTSFCIASESPRYRSYIKHSYEMRNRKCIHDELAGFDYENGLCH